MALDDESVDKKGIENYRDPNETFMRRFAALYHT